MERRKFGNTDLEVSAISLGCWIFGVDWWGHYTAGRLRPPLQLLPSIRASPSSTTATPTATAGPKTLFGNWMKTAKIDRSKIEIGGKVRLRLLLRPRRGRLAPRAQAGFLADSSCAIALEQSLKRLGDRLHRPVHGPQHQAPAVPRRHVRRAGEDEGRGQDQSLGRLPRPGDRLARGRHQGDAWSTAPRPCRPSTTSSSSTPAASSARSARAYKAGVLARVHDNCSILKDVVKIDTTIGENDHRKFRDNHWKVYGLKKLELVRHYAERPRHDRPPARLQVAADGARAHQHHRHAPERRRNQGSLRRRATSRA